MSESGIKEREKAGGEDEDGGVVSGEWMSSERKRARRVGGRDRAEWFALNPRK